MDLASCLNRGENGPQLSSYSSCALLVRREVLCLKLSGHCGHLLLGHLGLCLVLFAFLVVPAKLELGPKGVVRCDINPGPSIGIKQEPRVKITENSGLLQHTIGHSK